MGPIVLSFPKTQLTIQHYNDALSGTVDDDAECRVPTEYFCWASCKRDTAIPVRTYR